MRSEKRQEASPLRQKSRRFALRIVRLYQFLKSEYQEQTLSTQILKSGTSIGALVAEGQYAESKADLLHKLTIALKEASETDYWLTLLYESEYITQKMHESLQHDLNEILGMLVSSTRTLKEQCKNR